MGTESTSESRIDIEYVVGLMERWIKVAGLQVTTHSRGVSFRVLARDPESDKIRFAYRFRPRWYY